MSRDLERRLSDLAAEPRLADFARKLDDALARVRRDLPDEARARMEGLVAETLDRQMRLVESRRRAEAAFGELRARQAELSRVLHGLILRLAPDEGATRH